MPLPDRPHRTGIQASRMSPAGPVSIIAVALVFTVFWGTTTPLVAVITATTALAAGAFLIVLVFRTGGPRARLAGTAAVAVPPTRARPPGASRTARWQAERVDSWRRGFSM